MAGRGLDGMTEGIRALLVHRHEHRGDNLILRSTLQSILELYTGALAAEDGAAPPPDGAAQRRLEDTAARVCGTGALELIADALLLCEEGSIADGRTARSVEALCLEILEHLTRTEAGSRALVGSEVTRAECVRWMVVRSLGERFFGPGLLGRMETLIPSEEDFGRLCPR